ncbi:hypothetical protein [Baekduia sp.]|jgi:hypothetical protein|uniref:hypothetical protein n=1 Tax=Baekduia sp. TaxID=2600305 RepID=UPI002E053433|nr:hypothetical protein [Baekduia sp.]
MALLTSLRKAWDAVFNGSTGFKTPDVPRAQQLALGQAIIVVLIVLGFDLSDGTQQTLLGLSAAIGAALPVSDAVVRHGRANNVQELAAVQAETDALGVTSEDRDQIIAGLRRLR